MIFAFIAYLLYFQQLAAAQAQNLANKEAIRLNNAANKLADNGEYAKAILIHEQALAIREKTLGEKHPDTAASLNNLGSIFYDMQEYAKARQLHERALAIRLKSSGLQHLDTASSLCNLALVYSAMGDDAKALPLCERALVIREKALGPQHLDIANSLNNLALIYSSMRDDAKALELYERALTIIEKNFGRQHLTSCILINLGSIYANMSDYAKALPLIERALAISEKGFGPQHPNTVASLNSLGSIYSAMGDDAKALPLFERALANAEKFLGPQHPYTADSLNNLGMTHADMADYAKALPLCKRALAIRLKTSGLQHPDTAKCLSKLAWIYFWMGDYAKSIEFYEQALAIRKKALGLNHPDTADSLDKLAQVYYLNGDDNMARSLASSAIAADYRQLQTILSLDERSRLSWHGANSSYWAACVLRPDQLAEHSLRWKGVVLESLFGDRSLAVTASSDPQVATKLEEIQMLRAKLAKLSIENGGDVEMANVEKRIGQIQISLSKRANVGGRVRAETGMTIDAVVSALAEGSIFVDFIYFRDPKLQDEEAACYGALLTGDNGVPRYVRIDGAAAIDRAVDDLRTAITQSNEKEVEEKTKFLSEKIWKPLAAQIPENTRQLIICPEAKLNFLSFATLLDKDGRFVAEKFPIAYVGSGRDLTRKPSGKLSKYLTIFAAPAFDADGLRSPTKDLITMRSAEALAFGAIHLPPLPGTEIEAKALEVIAIDSAWNVRVFTGKKATEAAVRSTKQLGVLHLATHGFYLNSFLASAPPDVRGMSVIGNSGREPRQNVKGVDPMRASGVALTGSQKTLKLWSQRKAPESENDGILTADEVTSLDLDGTWLVTLSACETGVGEARNGEGVFGLRRAFMMAGAENLLMTLWPVSDHTTAEIMASFYKEALTSHDAVGSLAKVQRDWLVKLRKEKGLLAAVRDAAPFAMVTMTAPTHPPVTLSQPIPVVPESNTQNGP